jgi:hypothetical protein
LSAASSRSATYAAANIPHIPSSRRAFQRAIRTNAAQWRDRSLHQCQP